MVRPLLVANVIEEARWGGPQKRMVMVAKGLMERGVETVILTPQQNSTKFTDVMRAAGIQHEVLPISVIGRSLHAGAGFLLSFMPDVLRLYRRLRARPYDLVHVSGGAWQIRGVFAARMAGLPVAWHLNDTAPPKAVAGLFSFFAPRFSHAVFLAAYRCARRYLVYPSTAHLPRYSVPAPVDTRKYDCETTQPDPRIRSLPGCRIVSLSNINPIKGIELLLDSARVLLDEGLDFSVAIVGPVYATQTAYFKTLQARVRDLGLETRVHFLGNTDNVASCLVAADIYACSSVAEASPMSVWEAMAMSCPIVSTDVGDVAVYIESGRSGLVVEPGNVKAYSDALRRLIQNPEEARQMGRAARETVEARLDLSVVVEKTNRAYRETVARFRQDQEIGMQAPSQESTIVVEGLSAVMGGGQTYLRHLIANYQERPGERLVVIVPRSQLGAFPDVRGVDYVAPSYPEGGLLRRFIWYRLALPGLMRRVRARVLYCPGGLLANTISGCRAAVAFQNMLTFAPVERERFPLGYTRLRLALLSFLQKRAFMKADLLVFISNYAKTVVDASLPGRRGSSVVAPHGVGDDFRAPTTFPSGQDVPEPYVLYVSILDYYKAQVEVVEAWGLLQQQRPTKEKLLLIGPTGSTYTELVRRRIDQLGLADAVKIVGSVPYGLLPAYYQHARINIFASSCENCPNILLEALAAGRPTLCSSYQPMPEFGGDAVRYFNPYAPEELANLLAEMLDDPEALVHWGEKAAKQSEKYRWETSAQQTWAALRNLAQSPSSESNVQTI